MQTLYAERTSHSFHMVTLTLLTQESENDDDNRTRSCVPPFEPPMRFSKSAVSIKTPFQFSGKLFMQNTFDSTVTEEFLRIDAVHEANQENVSLLLHKYRFKVESNFEFDGEATIYLLKPNEHTPEECTTPPRKMSMSSSRSFNCDPPSRPSTSIFQNCFPTQTILDALRENFSYPLPKLPKQKQQNCPPPPPHPRQRLVNGHANSNGYGHARPPTAPPSSMPYTNGSPIVKMELKLLFELEYKYTLSEPNDGTFYKPKLQTKISKISSSLAIPLKKMLDQSIHSDVQLEVEGVVFPAHMSILASQSEVFKVMFDSNMVEKRTKRVIIRDMSAGAVKEMLNFLYTRDTSKFDKSLDMAIEMLHAAEKYIIADLRAASQRALEQTDLSKLAIDDILGLYLCSRTLSMPNVQVNCLNGLKSKGPFLGASKSFEKFCLEHPDIMPEFFTEFTCIKV